MVDFGYEFAEFWREFSKTISAVPDDNMEELVATFQKYFADNYKTSLKLVELNLTVEQIVGEDEEKKGEHNS